MNKNLQQELENLNINVAIIRDVYIGRTENKNLLVIYYTYDELLEDYFWELELNMNNTVNCYYNIEDLLEALRNYMKGVK